jgi:hypothetical protein
MLSFENIPGYFLMSNLPCFCSYEIGKTSKCQAKIAKENNEILALRDVT